MTLLCKGKKKILLSLVLKQIKAMDYLKIKKILLNEYQANGGSDQREFLRGMNYLEDYLESGRQDHTLNSHVDDIIVLREKVKSLEARVEELDRSLRDKRNIIKQYRQMNKDEKFRFKSSQEVARLEAVYSRMVMELEEKYKRKRFKHKPQGGTGGTEDKPGGWKVFKSHVRLTGN